eukprot:tig00020902_g15032.t1
MGEGTAAATVADVAAAAAAAAHGTGHEVEATIATQGALVARDYILMVVFILGYAGITVEHNIGINKGTTSIFLAVICWLIIFVSAPNAELANEELLHTLSEVSSIVFFLLGAVTIVELMDGHGGFRIIKRVIRIRSKRGLLWFIALLTFFVSAVLDNLTTTIGYLRASRIILSASLFTVIN